MKKPFDQYEKEALFLKGWFEAGCQIHGTYSPKTDYDQIRYAIESNMFPE